MSNPSSPISGNTEISNTISPPSLTKIHHLLTVKLDSKNYLMWKFQFMPLLRGYDLMGYVDGTIPCPPRTIPISTTGTTTSTTTIINPEYTSWVKQDQILLGWLLSSLTESVLAQIVGLETSADVWNALQRHFASSSRSRIMQLRRELQLLKKDLQQYILNGLDSAYDAIVITLTTTNVDITLEDFQAHLLSFEMRLESQNSILGAAPTAHLARSNSNYVKRSGNNYHQSFPRSSNHVRNNTGRPQNQQRGRSSNGAPLSGPCQLCGRKNHHVVNCWHRFDKDFSPRDTPAPTAYVATSQPINTSTWLPNSGATHHVTSDLSNLQIYSDYDGPDQMLVGNGNSVPVAHVGPSKRESGTSRTP